jgi:hypothetical protein
MPFPATLPTKVRSTTIRFAAPDLFLLIPVVHQQFVRHVNQDTVGIRSGGAIKLFP